MKRSSMFFLLIMAVIVSSPGVLWATPVLNTAGDGFEDVGGNAYAYYQNSGSYLGFGNYNNENPKYFELLENDIETWLKIDDFELELTDSSAITVTGVDSGGSEVSDPTTALSGEWEVDTSKYPGGIQLYAVKAKTGFVMYLEEPSATDGSWSTYDLWRDLTERDLFSGDSIELSHFTGYSASTSVPEPATILLMGAGVVGLLGFRRRFNRKVT